MAWWIFFGAAEFWLEALALLATTGIGTAAGWAWQTSCTGQLTWNGECWYWDTLGDLSSSQVSSVSVIADVQFALLVFLDSPGSAKRWLWVERASQAERWMDLRRAVFASRRDPKSSGRSTN